LSVAGVLGALNPKWQSAQRLDNFVESPWGASTPKMPDGFCAKRNVVDARISAQIKIVIRGCMGGVLI
jgi:hypothetical protein